MRQDAGTTLRELRVDGGMVVNDLLMQLQADILDIDVIRPRVAETTALGAPMTALVHPHADVLQLGVIQQPMARAFPSGS